MNFGITELSKASLFTFYSDALTGNVKIAKTRKQLREAMLHMQPPQNTNVIFDLARVNISDKEAKEMLCVAQKNIVESEEHGGRGGKFVLVGVDKATQRALSAMDSFTFKDTNTQAINYLNGDIQNEVHTQGKSHFNVLERYPFYHVIQITDKELVGKETVEAFAEQLTQQISVNKETGTPDIGIILDFSKVRAIDGNAIQKIRAFNDYLERNFAVVNLSDEMVTAAFGVKKHFPIQEHIHFTNSIDAAKAILARGHDDILFVPDIESAQQALHAAHDKPTSTATGAVIDEHNKQAAHQF